MTTVDTAYTVRPTRPQDEPELLDLMARALGGGPSANQSVDFYRWKHVQNPFGPSAGLVAEHEGRLVGVRLFLRWRLESEGSSYLAVRAVDTATDAEFRGLGIFRRLTLGLLEHLENAGEIDLVFNTPNANSRPGYLKMGWSMVGTLPVLVSPVHPARLLRGARSASRRTAPVEGTGSVGVPVDRRPPPFEDPQIVLSRHSQAVTDLLNESVKPAGFHTPRTLDYLRWRYADAPGHDYRCITVQTGGSLIGLAFGHLRPRGRLQEFSLSEVIVRDGDRRTASELMRAARRSGADHVATHAAPGTESSAVALTCGYFSVPRQGIGLAVNPRRRLPLDPRNPASWQLSLGDLEVF